MVPEEVVTALQVLATPRHHVLRADAGVVGRAAAKRGRDDPADLARRDLLCEPLERDLASCPEKSPIATTLALFWMIDADALD